MRDPLHPVIRVKPLTQLVAVPLPGVFVVGIGWGLVDAVTHGDPGYPFRTDGFGWFGITVGWVIAGTLGSACFFSALLVLRLRVALSPDGFDARAYFRHYRLGLDRVTRLQALAGSGPLVMAPRFPGVRVTAREASGRRRGFQLNRVYNDVDRAVPVLTAWVRERPDLVQDDATRDLVRSWGVDLPEPAAPPPPSHVSGPVTFLRTDGGQFTLDPDRERSTRG